MASTFSWMEPLRLYLIGITLLVLGFAWYQHLKTKKEIDCNCETDQKPSFIQSRKFLVFITLFAGLMTAFPYYSSIFYADNPKEQSDVLQEDVVQITYQVEGMTCTSCEEHVMHAVNKLDGIISVFASYENADAVVKFDKSKVSEEKVAEAIQTTGYEVLSAKK